MTSAHEGFLEIAFFALSGIAALIVVSVLGAIAQAIVVLLRERREARPPPWEVCRECGYNLIASRGHCPECGLPIPPWPVQRPRIRIYRGVVLVESGRGRDQKHDDVLERWLRSAARGIRSALRQALRF